MSLSLLDKVLLPIALILIATAVQDAITLSSLFWFAFLVWIVPVIVYNSILSFLRHGVFDKASPSASYRIWKQGRAC